MDSNINQSIPSPNLILPLKSSSNQSVNKLINKDGRVRSYPHQRGQWTTFPFVELFEDLFQDFLELIDNDNIKKMTKECIHLSLVRGHYALRHHQISSFVSTLSQKVALINSFSVCLSEFKLFKNDEKTRCFICMCQSTKSFCNSSSELLLNCIKSVLNEFNSKVICNQNNEDDQFTFHSSIAWCLPQYEDSAQTLVNYLNSLDEPILVKVNQIKVKIGDQFFTFNLKSS